MSSVDVVVVSYNNEEHLRRCVEPLAASPDAHAIVVDSASSDRSLESVADLSVTIVPLAENRGFSYACNVGWRRGRAPFVLFLNPDAGIDARSLAVLLRVADESSDVGVVAPRILGEDGALDYSLRRFPCLRSTYAQALFVHRVFPHAEWSDELVRNQDAYLHRWSPDWVSGACILVRRSLLEQLQGFDERFFLYSEDRDLCQRARLAGSRIVFEPRAVAVHEGGGSAPRAALLPVLASSRIMYARKHQPPHVALLERGGIAIGALTHALVTRRGRDSRRGFLSALGVALGLVPLRTLGESEAARGRTGSSRSADEARTS